MTPMHPIVKHGASWMLLIGLLGLVVVGSNALFGASDVQWGIITAASFVSLILGAQALVQMVRVARNWPTFLHLSFIYQKLWLALALASRAELTLSDALGWNTGIPEWLSDAAIYGSLFTIFCLNVSLFWGRPKIRRDGTISEGWLYVRCDPIPFRALYRQLRGREPLEPQQQRLQEHEKKERTAWRMNHTDAD